MNKVALVSGGLDSLLVHHLHPDATPLFVNYGQQYAMLELQAVERLWPEGLETARISAKDLSEDIYVPARNLMLACIAIRYGTRILMGGMADDDCADKTPEAFAAMSGILTSQAKTEVSVESPFWNTPKAEAVAHYLDAGGSPERLLKTVSCYSASKEPCLNCPACFRWAVALRVNGLKVPPPAKGITQDYLVRLHTYPACRIWSTLRAIETPETPVWNVDIDGVLTQETQGHDYYKRTVKPGARERLLELQASGAWIILNTSRSEMDRNVTQGWLYRNEIPYHALLMEKPPATHRVDDSRVAL